MWNFEFLSSLCLSICQRLLSFNLSINESINESISQTSNQSNIHPINQSSNQAINQAINQYIFLLPFVSCLFLSSLFLCPSHYLSNVVWFLFSYYTLLLFLNWLFRSLLSHNSLWISQHNIKCSSTVTCYLLIDERLKYVLLSKRRLWMSELTHCIH
jgi:cell division protein FtsW (lipid II flippase)